MGELFDKWEALEDERVRLANQVSELEAELIRRSEACDAEAGEHVCAVCFRLASQHSDAEACCTGCPCQSEGQGFAVGEPPASFTNDVQAELEARMTDPSPQPEPSGWRAKESPAWDALAEAMQSAWDSFVGDTGCFPDCFELKGRKLYADFSVGNFKVMVADHMRAKLSGPQGREVAEGLGMGVGAWWCKGADVPFGKKCGPGHPTEPLFRLPRREG